MCFVLIANIRWYGSLMVHSCVNTVCNTTNEKRVVLNVSTRFRN